MDLLELATTMVGVRHIDTHCCGQYANLVVTKCGNNNVFPVVRIYIYIYIYILKKNFPSEYKSIKVCYTHV